MYYTIRKAYYLLLYRFFKKLMDKIGGRKYFVTTNVVDNAFEYNTFIDYHKN